MSSAGGAGALMSLKNKMQSLREEMDKSKDQYELKCKELEAEQALRSQAESELAGLTRKLQLLEDDFEQTQSRLKSATEQLVELGKVADESERGRKALENRQNLDDDRITTLERMVKESSASGEEAERKYEEVARKLQLCTSELDKAEDRADTAEMKVKTLDTELHIVTNTLKSLELNESKASQREDTYEGTIKDLSARLKDAETRASEAERSATKLQFDVDRLEEELQQQKARNKVLQEEMDTAFQEIQNI